MKYLIYEFVPKLKFKSNSIKEIARKLKRDRANCYRLLEERVKGKPKFLIKRAKPRSAELDPNMARTRRP